MAFLSQIGCGSFREHMSGRHDGSEDCQVKNDQTKNHLKHNQKILSQDSVKISHCRLSAMDCSTRRERSSNIFPLSQYASVTIEASLALTFFLLFFLAVIGLFLIMDLQLSIQNTLELLGDETVKACVLDQGDEENGLEGIREAIQEGLAKEILKSRFLTLLQEQWEEGGDGHPGKSILSEDRGGISFSKSEIDLDRGQILLAVTYSVELPVGIMSLQEFSITQYSYRYGWMGDDTGTVTEGTEGQLVYITEDSQVYHLSEDCTYLRLSIHTVPVSELWERRNAGGGVYTACELCKPDATANPVYVTDYGDRYHGSLACSSLKRSFQAVSLSQVGDRRLCSRCAKTSQSESSVGEMAEE